MINNDFWQEKQRVFEEKIKQKTIDKSSLEELYKISYELLEKSEKHRETLESKAELLIRTLGIGVTIMLAASGFLADKIVLSKIPAIWMSVFKSTYLFTAGSLLFIIGFIVKTIKPISSYRTINYEDVFQENITEDVLKYKLFLAIHYWKIFLENYKINETKGKYLKKTYELFLIPLIGIFILLSTLFYVL